MWRQIVKAPDTLQCPSRFQEKGPPALSPGTDPPSIERVLLGRGGLPVLAFHLNQATSTNKALIINAFTERNTMPPPPAPCSCPSKDEPENRWSNIVWRYNSCFETNYGLLDVFKTFSAWFISHCHLLFCLIYNFNFDDLKCAYRF